MQIFVIFSSFIWSKINVYYKFVEIYFVDHSQQKKIVQKKNRNTFHFFHVFVKQKNKKYGYIIFAHISEHCTSFETKKISQFMREGGGCPCKSFPRIGTIFVSWNLQCLLRKFHNTSRSEQGFLHV